MPPRRKKIRIKPGIKVMIKKVAKRLLPKSKKAKNPKDGSKAKKKAKKAKKSKKGLKTNELIKHILDKVIGRKSVKVKRKNKAGKASGITRIPAMPLNPVSASYNAALGGLILQKEIENMKELHKAEKKMLQKEMKNYLLENKGEEIVRHAAMPPPRPDHMDGYVDYGDGVKMTPHAKHKFEKGFNMFKDKLSDQSKKLEKQAKQLAKEEVKNMKNELGKKTIPLLKKDAKKRNVTLGSKMNKADILEALWSKGYADVEKEIYARILGELEEKADQESKVVVEEEADDSPAAVQVIDFDEKKIARKRKEKDAEQDKDDRKQFRESATEMRGKQGAREKIGTYLDKRKKLLDARNKVSKISKFDRRAFDKWMEQGFLRNDQSKAEYQYEQDIEMRKKKEKELNDAVAERRKRASELADTISKYLTDEEARQYMPSISQQRYDKYQDLKDLDPDVQEPQSPKEEEPQSAPPSPKEKKKFIPVHLRGQQGQGIARGAPLSTTDINKMMKKYPSYLGTFARDDLKKLHKAVKPGKKVMFVFNTDTSNKEGKHWQSVYIDPVESNSVEFYDSFGAKAPPALLKDLKKIIEALKPKTYLKFKENRIKQQSVTSANCGWFAIRFLIDRSRGKPFPEASGFSDVAKNEKDIKKFKSKFPQFNYI